MGYLNRSRSANMRFQLCYAMAIAGLVFGVMSSRFANAASEGEGYPALVKLFEQ